MTGFSLISAVAGAYFPEHAPKSVNLSSLKHLEWGRATEVRRRAFPPCSQFFRLNHFTESLKQAELVTDLVMSNLLHITQFALHKQYCKQFC